MRRGNQNAWRARRGVLGVLLALCALGALTLGVLLGMVVASEDDERLGQADCIIVLGCKVQPDGSASYSLRERTARAAALYKEGYAKKIIVTGGQGKDEPVSEARVMAQGLAALGVPRQDILLEEQAANTRQNIALSKRIMQDEGWTSALVVTSEFHRMRAVWTAKQAGIAQVYSAAAPSYPPHLWRQRIKETLSIVKFALGG
nr:YdcF family protein [Maliibacterium massiliense]